MARDSGEATEHLDRALILMGADPQSEADDARAALHLAAAQTMAFGALVEAVNLLVRDVEWITQLLAHVIDAPVTADLPVGSFRVSER